MTILALYVPKPEELFTSIIHLAIAYSVLCLMAVRMKLSVPIAAGLMALGSGIAIAPDIYAASKENLGDYGNMAREWSKTNYSDAYFSITGYMYVGRGKPLAFAGMSVAIVIYAAVAKARGRIRRSPDSPETPPQGMSSEERPHSEIPSD